MKISGSGLIKSFLTWLSVFVLWSFMFTMTKTSWSSIVYVFLAGFAVVLGLLAIMYKPNQINSRLCLWIPFVFLSLYGNYKLGNIEGIIYWFICLALIFFANRIDWENAFPERVLFVSGVIMIVGIIFQIVFPSIYNTYIATFFKNTNDILYWSNGYGYAGFTYQLGVTAIILIYFEGILLYNDFNNKNIKNILLFITIIFIFLTGKRAVALLAILLPIMVMILSKKIASKRTFNIMLALTIVGIIVYIMAMNAELFVNSRLLGRFASTIIDMENGQDFSSHRSVLYTDAIQLFNNNKLFGIGLGQYKELSQYGTDVHNAYLQVLCELGIVGFVCYVVPLAINVLICIKRNRAEESKQLKISLFIQLFFILYGFTGNVSVNEFCYMFYFISICMMIGYKKQEIAYK